MPTPRGVALRAPNTPTRALVAPPPSPEPPPPPKVKTEQSGPNIMHLLTRREIGRPTRRAHWPDEQRKQRFRENKLRTHAINVHGVTGSRANGRYYAYIDNENTAVIFNLSTKQEVKRYQLPTPEPGHKYLRPWLSPQGSMVCIATPRVGDHEFTRYLPNEGEFHVISADTPHKLLKFDEQFDLTFTNVIGRYLFVANSDSGLVEPFDIETGNRTALNLPLTNPLPWRLAASSDTNQALLFQPGGRQIGIFSATSGHTRWVTPLMRERELLEKVYLHGSELICCITDNTFPNTATAKICIFDAVTGAFCSKYDLSEYAVMQFLRIQANSQYLAISVLNDSKGRQKIIVFNRASHQLRILHTGASVRLGIFSLDDDIVLVQQLHPRQRQKRFAFDLKNFSRIHKSVRPTSDVDDIMGGMFLSEKRSIEDPNRISMVLIEE